MPGIAAVLNLDGSAVADSQIEQLADALKPYGPDQQGSLIRGSAGFVSCLDYLTPEDRFDRQPLVLGDRFIMLFDGRIDNRSELGETLGIGTNELDSMPDSLIALRLFERWGHKGFERILGDFAIIIMDLQQGCLIGVVDHMGLRGLHYYRSDKRFAVATAPDALFALGWVPRRLNKQRLAETLARCHSDLETTYYQDINRVLPGCIVRVREGKVSTERFWDPLNIASVKFKRDDDYVEAFQEHFSRAVKARLRGFGAPCATITGGLDSSSIAVTAADMLAAHGEKLNTYTQVPEAGFHLDDLRGNYFDERPYVRQIAAANPNLVPHFIEPRTEPILDQMAKQVRLADSPEPAVLNGIWIMDICAAARSAGHKIMLVGEMGNLTFSYGGWELFAELVRRGRWLRLIREIKATGYKWQKAVRQATIRPFIPAPLFLKYKQLRHGGAKPWDSSFIDPEFAATSGPAVHYQRLVGTKQLRVKRFEMYSEVSDWYAKLRAEYGIDTRTPAFDRRLVEFCIGIPTDQYLRKGCDRWLIRRAMKGRLPDTVLYNKRTGIQSADWFPRLTREREHLEEEVRRLALNEEVASILDLNQLASALKNWPERQPPLYSPESGRLRAIPPAFAMAYFVEKYTG